MIFWLVLLGTKKGSTRRRSRSSSRTSFILYPQFQTEFRDFGRKKGKKVERGKDACNNTNNKGVLQEENYNSY
jgi:hypothetical protein